MKENLKYKLAILIRYIGDSLYYPFISLYLVNNGLIKSQIGFILSITPIIGILMNPVYTAICKNLNKTRITLIIISFLEAAMISIIGFIHNFYAITVIAILIAIFGSSHYGLLDSLTTVHAKNTNTSYSSYRVFGSIAYVFGTTVAGYIIKYTSYGITFVIGAASLMAAGILYIFLKPLQNKEEVVKEKASFKEVITNKDYIFFLVFYTLCTALTTGSENFFSVFLESKGVTSNQYGLIYSYFVIFEVIAVFILNKLKKQNIYNFHIIASLIVFIRYLFNFLDLNLYLTIFISAFRGIAFAMYFHVTYKYINNMLGNKNSVLGIMIATLTQSILTAILTNVYGVIIDNHGYKVFYLIAFIISAVVLLLSIIRKLYYHKHPQTFIEESLQLETNKK